MSSFRSTFLIGMAVLGVVLLVGSIFLPMVVNSYSNDVADDKLLEFESGYADKRFLEVFECDDTNIAIKTSVKGLLHMTNVTDVIYVLDNHIFTNRIVTFSVFANDGSVTIRYFATMYFKGDFVIQNGHWIDALNDEVLI